ncbi:MAG TPA: RidA family protein, partial [Blastocatellia bacterium]|nr:RidA family protein [Blastocatellia bacterium]
MDKYEAAIAELGLSFPEPTAPIANFVPYVITGSLVYTSGHVPVRDGQVCFIGKLGREFAVEQGQEA